MEKRSENENDNILAEKDKEALISFLEQVDLCILTKGIRNLLLEYLKKEEDQESWFGVFLMELSVLFDFLDELEEEHPPNI